MSKMSEKVTGFAVCIPIVMLLSFVAFATYAQFATAHDGTKAHNRAQEFHFNYNAQFGVYCGWRHSYEGISCVKVKGVSKYNY